MTEIISNPVAERLKLGPREGVTYPIIMKYCGNCSMPIEVSKQKDKSKHLKDLQISTFFFAISVL